MFTVQQAFFAALLVGALSGVQAGDIYRWVDGQGRTHLSDVVPEKYKNAATRIGSGQYALTPEQQRDAASRAARESARTTEPPQSRVTGASPQATPTTPVPPRVIKRPAQAVTESTDCTTWRRLFHESEECFGPFRTVGGGIKPEAFDHCNEIPSPLLMCGPETN